MCASGSEWSSAKPCFKSILCPILAGVEKGLVDLLTGAVRAEDVLVFRKDLKLMIVPGGSKSLNRPDVLGSERMKALVAYLRESFDYVVVDTPPVGPVVDAAIVARLIDKTVFVVRWGSTPREVVETSVQQISKQKRIGGIVENMAAGTTTEGVMKGTTPNDRLGTDPALSDLRQGRFYLDELTSRLRWQ